MLFKSSILAALVLSGSAMADPSEQYIAILTAKVRALENQVKENKTAIEKAQASANSAQTAANNAQASANSAQSSANNAWIAANKAGESASNAQAVANESQKIANSALIAANNPHYGEYYPTIGELSAKLSDCRAVDIMGQGCRAAAHRYCVSVGFKSGLLVEYDGRTAVAVVACFR